MLSEKHISSLLFARELVRLGHKVTIIITPTEKWHFKEYIYDSVQIVESQTGFGSLRSGWDPVNV